MSEISDDQQKNVAAAVQIAASIFQGMPETDFIVCAIQRNEKGEVKAAAISNNLGWRDGEKNFEMQPPSIGTMTDLLVEAELFVRIDKLQKQNWRNEDMGKRDKPINQ